MRVINENWNKLKKHWGIKSNFQVVVILIVFAVTGFSALYSHKFIDYILGIDSDTGFWVKLVIFVFMVLPLWTVYLFIWGTMLGQREFVTKFIKIKIKLLLNKK